MTLDLPLASKNARQKYVSSLLERFGSFFILGLTRDLIRIPNRIIDAIIFAKL